MSRVGRFAKGSIVGVQALARWRAGLAGCRDGTARELELLQRYHERRASGLRSASTAGGGRGGGAGAGKGPAPRPAYHFMVPKTGIPSRSRT